MPVSREVVEGLQLQGIDEQIAYKLTTTPWGSLPSGVSVKAYDVTDSNKYTDVSLTILSGSASVSGDVITTPIVKSLSNGKLYRVEIKWTSSGNILEAYIKIKAER